MEDLTTPEDEAKGSDGVLELLLRTFLLCGFAPPASLRGDEGLEDWGAWEVKETDETETSTLKALDEASTSFIVNQKQINAIDKEDEGVGNFMRDKGKMKDSGSKGRKARTV